MQKEERPMRIFIYQPFYTKDADGKKEYLNTKTYKFPYFPVKKGDVFVTEKRVQEFVELTKDQESKVRVVRYNLSDMTCNVLLENKVLTGVENTKAIARKKANEEAKAEAETKEKEEEETKKEPTAS